MDMHGQLRAIYMQMDPHHLNASQLDYEITLRGLDPPKSLRSRAKAVRERMVNETLGHTTLDHLYRSPVETGENMRVCVNLCRTLDAATKRPRIDSATLDTLWSQSVHLIARLDRLITAGEYMKKTKFEMLFWAETIRERIESQKSPNMEFIPSVEIPVRYQQIPNLIDTENIPDDSTLDREKMDQLSERLKNVSPIELLSNGKSSTPFSAPSTQATENVHQSTSLTEDVNIQKQPDQTLSTTVNSLTPDAQAQPRDSFTRHRRASWLRSELETPQSILKTVDQMRVRIDTKSRDTKFIGHPNVYNKQRSTVNERIETCFGTTDIIGGTIQRNANAVYCTNFYD